MPETKDELHQLFQAAGHSGPDKDLTDRIMARVAVTPILRRTPVEPLLGRTAWVSIGVIGALLMATAIVIGQGTVGTGTFAHYLFNDLFRTLPGIGNWAVWLTGLSGSLVVLATLDRALSVRGRSI